jgi:arginyl-tRNA--protein-N-Asp/Glu arginylyltransferase
MKVEVSTGEILDKVSILYLKKELILDKAKLTNIIKEYDTLYQVIEEFTYNVEVYKLYNKLLEVNRDLWHIEDKLREKERYKEFNQEFIELARDVYFTNDKRAEIKKQINILTNSELIEEKSYEQY